MGVEHVVAKNPTEIGDQVREVVRLEKRQGLAIDLDNPNAVGTGLHPGQIPRRRAPRSVTPCCRQLVEKLPEVRCNPPATAIPARDRTSPRTYRDPQITKHLTDLRFVA